MLHLGLITRKLLSLTCVRGLIDFAKGFLEPIRAARRLG